MKKIILFFLKPLSFLPALCMMYAIYSFSAQTGEDSGNLSYTVSYKIVEIGNDTFDVGLSEDRISYYATRIEYPVRKLAHMTEYFCLAVAVSFPFYVYGLRGFLLMLVAGLICVAFAAGDEYHQSFVAGRGPSKKDVIIDSIGALGGIITVRIICWTFLTPFRVAKRIEDRARRKEMARRRAKERERARHRTTARRRTKKLDYDYNYDSDYDDDYDYDYDDYYDDYDDYDDYDYDDYYDDYDDYDDYDYDDYYDDYDSDYVYDSRAEKSGRKRPVRQTNRRNVSQSRYERPKYPASRRSVEQSRRNARG